LPLIATDFRTNGSKGNPQALVQWSEVANHPGMVCSMTQQTNNPVILMITPTTIQVQEIKVQPAKAKVRVIMMGLCCL
jgi:E3 ubiquitin-protein ligase UBR4